ncbi:aldo/keto reductase [Bifidobacterium apri]|uniref:Oxidoreductase n=2 Tax=Bifidobacterium apri TaxID=1769423 RepID=A0A6A2V933_9BIFI|nr:oxidoreductase [Bifidobacterium apri]
MRLTSCTDAFTLSNGNAIPCIGYGTFETPADEARKAVREALEAGYRHIDTAAIYGNQEAVGAGIRDSGIPREQLFVTSKLWNTERGYDKTLKACEQTLNELGTDYLDLYLIHWPANRKQFGDRAQELNAETWRAFEELYKSGRVKAIGLSNFLPHHIEALVSSAAVMPMVDQLEVHPGWPQAAAVRYCQEHRIQVEAWGPFGHREVLDNQTLVSIGRKYGKSSAQVCVRWALQHNVLPLPKSVHADRMRANIDVFDFELTDEDMHVIDGLRDLGGSCSDPDAVDF